MAELFRVEITRRELLKLPIETRRRILKEQAESLTEADKRQAEFESCPTSVDYDNDCAP